MEHASSHARQAVHRSGWITRVFAMRTSRVQRPTRGARSADDGARDRRGIGMRGASADLRRHGCRLQRPRRRRHLAVSTPRDSRLSRGLADADVRRERGHSHRGGTRAARNRFTDSAVHLIESVSGLVRPGAEGPERTAGTGRLLGVAGPTPVENEPVGRQPPRRVGQERTDGCLDLLRVLGVH